MAFQVKLLADNDSGTQFSDEDQFEFLEQGVLKITVGSEVTYYGPAAWQGVRTSNNHRPVQHLRVAARKLPGT